MIMEINTRVKTQDYILLIFNCFKYQHKALKQKETWLQNIPTNLLYFHVLGNPELEKDYIVDEDAHILYVKTADDYNSLPKKVIAAYKTIHKLYNFKYIFKTDDDQMMTNTRFFKILMNVLDSKQMTESVQHYGGHIVDVKQPYRSEYYRVHPELPNNLIVKTTKYCSGRFYFLSDTAVQILVSRESFVSAEYLEDYAVGYNLPDYLKTNMTNLDTSKYFIDFC